jgi:hypothetical protein
MPLALGIAVPATGALLLAFWLAVQTHEANGPVWRGKALSSWSVELQSTNLHERADAETALREMGAKAVPTLTRWLARRDADVVKDMDKLLAKVGLARPYLWTEGSHRSRALCGFRALGTNGQPAGPYLRHLMSQPATAQEAAFALVWVAPAEAEKVADAWINGTNATRRTWGLRIKQEIVEAGKH